MFQATDIIRLFPLATKSNISSKQLAKKYFYSSSHSSSSKWKTPLIFALIFAIIHISVVSIFNEENSVLVSDPPPHSFIKRDIRSVEHVEHDLKPENDEVDRDKKSQSHIDRDLVIEDDEHSAENELIDRNICKNGHIQGMRSICHQQSCLHQLKDFQGYPVPKKSLDSVAESSSAAKLYQKFEISQLRFLKGSYDPVNFPLVSLMTNVQKHFGIHGSVGLIQTHLDKFSCFLVSTIDRNIGEKLIIVHPFNETNWPYITNSVNGKLSGMPSDKELYVKHLKELGFVDQTQQGDPFSREFYLFDESSVSIPNVLSNYKIPQFRIISLSSDPSDSLALLSGLEAAACNLRDGGLIILSFRNGDPYPVPSLRTILGMKFGNALSVVLATSDRIYLTTTNWTNQYQEFIFRHSASLRSGLATFDKSTGYYMST